MVRPRARSMKRARKTRRLHRGGEGLSSYNPFSSSTPSSTDTWGSWFSKQGEKVTGLFGTGAASTAPAPAPAPATKETERIGLGLGFGQQGAAAAGGGKRRKKRRRMRGGNGNGDQSNIGSVSVTPSMYKYGSDAAEVHDIQMAQPDTLVGGRRRRRGSRSRGKSRRSSRRN